MKYKILKQKEYDERLFELQDENGDRFSVDIYTDGKFTHPVGVDLTNESWRQWLGTFVGKEIYIERISPYAYFSSGETYLIESELPTPNDKSK